jgi:hypothetical protein
MMIGVVAVARFFGAASSAEAADEVVAAIAVGGGFVVVVVFVHGDIIIGGVFGVHLWSKFSIVLVMIIKLVEAFKSSLQTTESLVVV